MSEAKEWVIASSGLRDRDGDQDLVGFSLVDEDLAVPWSRITRRRVARLHREGPDAVPVNGCVLAQVTTATLRQTTRRLPSATIPE